MKKRREDNGFDWVLSSMSDINSIIEIKLGSKAPLTSDDARETYIRCNFIIPGVLGKLADGDHQVFHQDNFCRP